MEILLWPILIPLGMLRLSIRKTFRGIDKDSDALSSKELANQGGILILEFIALVGGLSMFFAVAYLIATTIFDWLLEALN